MTEPLPNLPDRLFLNRALQPLLEPTFARHPEGGGRWVILGRADQLVEGAVVDVLRYRQSPIAVRVGKPIAERTVNHKPGRHYAPGPVRYVLTEFANLDQP